MGYAGHMDPYDDMPDLESSDDDLPDLLSSEDSSEDDDLPDLLSSADSSEDWCTGVRRSHPMLDHILGVGTYEEELVCLMHQVTDLLLSHVSRERETTSSIWQSAEPASNVD